MSTTTVPSTPAAGSSPQRDRVARRVTWASLVGTALESYDFYVFSYAAAFFAGPLFFAPLGAFGGTLSALATIGVGFIVRPLGAIVFGHLGDRIGRRRTLLLTIAIMGVATGLIGVLPTYAAAGWLGAALLVLLRLVQGFSLGGEWGGSILLATEHASPRRRAFYAAMPQLGSPVGSIVSAVAYLVLATLPHAALLSWGWRIPFLLAIPLLLVSLYLRWSIDETPVFRELVREHRVDRVPVLTVLRRRPLALLVGVGAALLGIGSYSLMNTYTLSYGSSALGYDYDQLLLATTIGGLLQLVTIPLFGAWATRIGSAAVVALGAASTAVIAVPMYLLLQSATFPVLVGMMIVGGILPTLSWAALGGLMSDLFADHYCYSALSIAYSVAAVVSGFVPSITQLLAGATHGAWWHPAIVLVVMSLVTLVAAIVAGRMRASSRSARAVDPVPARP